MLFKWYGHILQWFWKLCTEHWFFPPSRCIYTQCEQLQCVRSGRKESRCAFSLEILTSGWWFVILYISVTVWMAGRKTGIACAFIFLVKSKLLLWPCSHFTVIIPTSYLSVCMLHCRWVRLIAVQSWQLHPWATYRHSLSLECIPFPSAVVWN